MRFSLWIRLGINGLLTVIFENMERIQLNSDQTKYTYVEKSLTRYTINSQTLGL